MNIVKVGNGVIGDDTEFCICEVYNEFYYPTPIMVKIAWGCPGYSIGFWNLNTMQYVELTPEFKAEIYKFTDPKLNKVQNDPRRKELATWKDMMAELMVEVITFAVKGSEKAFELID